MRIGQKNKLTYMWARKGTHPRSPELNPEENVWQFMRQSWLSNRVFRTYDDIVALACEAWNKLIDQPWRIMSLGLREWTMIGQPQ